MPVFDRPMSRREIMKLGLFSSAALMLPAERLARTQVALANRIPASALPQPFTIPFTTPPVLAPERQTLNHDYYALTQRQASTEILPGLRTDIWGYNGITPGPTIVTQQGRAAVMQQINELPAVHPTLRYNVWTSTHLHGSASKPQYDGYASDITDVGCWKDYVYPNFQEARTLWYHDHGVHNTAPNAYMGLAAMYILHDPYELSLPIPHGAYDVPLVLRDAMFESNGQLLYEDNEHSGVYGDVVLVNGVPWPNMRVERRKYRFRVLNAAIARSFDLKLDTGEPLTVIGTDGGLMPHPMPVGNLKVGNAERYEVVIDFSKYQIGQRVVMQNISPKNNIDYETTEVVMAFDVVAEASDTSNNEVPYDLNPRTHVMGLQESDAVRTRHFEFKRSSDKWTINDTTWADVVNSDYKMVLANPGVDDVEIWELENTSGGWFHPVHIHLVDFKILDRNGLPPEDFERGPKDTVYLGEGETIRVIMRFSHEQGRYMIHCHNLVHEDHDMMAQFLVGEDSPDCDPVHADKPGEKPARPLRDRRDDHEEDEDDDGGGGSHGGDDRLSFDQHVLPVGNTNVSVPKARGSSVRTTCAPKKTTPVKKKTKRKVKAKSRTTKVNGRGKVAGAASKSKATSARCATPVKRTMPARRKRTSKRKLPAASKAKPFSSSR
jgi:spore coat protein A